MTLREDIYGIQRGMPVDIHIAVSVAERVQDYLRGLPVGDSVQLISVREC